MVVTLASHPYSAPDPARRATARAEGIEFECRPRLNRIQAGKRHRIPRQESGGGFPTVRRRMTLGEETPVILEIIYSRWMMELKTLPTGKLPAEVLAHCLAQTPVNDPRVILGPGLGLDCAIVEAGSTLWAITSDPITFATDEIGWYVVQINANDIATTGAVPRWLLATVLLPEKKTTAALAEGIHQQIYKACQAMNISLIGGHTEITYGFQRPIAVGTLIGEVDREHLVTPQGAKPGDRVLLTKGVPIEATAILARECPDRLEQMLTPEEIAQAKDFLLKPGISVLEDAQLAMQAGRVTAMHDPTEGGLSTALWELAQASHCSLSVDLDKVPILPLSARICEVFQVDPLAAIASGALLLTAPTPDAESICQALQAAGLVCHDIGEVEAGEAVVWYQSRSGRSKLAYPHRDELARVLSAESLLGEKST